MARKPVSGLILSTALQLTAPARAEDPDGWFVSLPGTITSITGDGSTALGYRDHDGRIQAFRWTERGGIVPLWSIDSVLWERPAFFVHDPFTSRAPDEEFDLDAWSPFAWYMTAAAPAPLYPIWSEYIGMTGLSVDGSIVVGSTHARGLLEAYRSSPERGFEYLGNCLGSESSRADLVSRNGEVVVGSCGYSGEQVFRWTREGGMLGLGTGMATGISGDGSVIVGYSRGFRSSMQGFLWRKETGMTLFPGGTETCIPWGASFDGSTIIGGGCSRADKTYGYGFLWDSVNGLRDVDRLLASARVDIDDRHFIPITVSDDGRTLAGRILSPATGYEGWIASLPLPRATKPPKEGPLPRPDLPVPPPEWKLAVPLAGSAAAGIVAILLWYYLVLASMSSSAPRARGRRL